MTGYQYCGCRDCMEIALGKPGKALCLDCQDAGCVAQSGECQRDHIPDLDEIGKTEGNDLC